MKRIDLNGIWRMTGAGFDVEGTIPGSVYSFLLAKGLMEDPFYRDNETKALALMEQEFTFERSFDLESVPRHASLRCLGLDTLTTIYVNDKKIAETDNMHRSYRFPLRNLTIGNNTIRVVFHPVNPYIKAKQKEHPVFCLPDCMQGFSHLRKAHCMMGWDWGARLPDAGIWRDIFIADEDTAEIEEVEFKQEFRDGKVYVTPHVRATRKAAVSVTLYAPNGGALVLQNNRTKELKDPMLWYPNGLGAQPLYTLVCEAWEGDLVVDTNTKRIGIRKMELVRERDKYGESFYHRVNDLPFFAMGADYIPEDNILSRVTKERSRILLQDAKDSHFNAIRIWGGGYYPDDWFFDLCDEMGIIVFFDLMFACAAYYFDVAFKENVRLEIIDNMKRLRHHPCIALISGNNEVEQFFPIKNCDTPEYSELQLQYLSVFEDMIPEILKEVWPDIPYVPSSPSTLGHFIATQNENYGDSHYWAVWHGNLPFTDYRKHFFRYVSEFGFQSFPSMKTIESFTLPEDRNIFSRIMEKHQRNGSANGKILKYLSDTYLYPTSFETLLYASQLLQAEAIRYGVEHLRRNRGRCMGTLYWQLNDIWPVASWASIDYYGRWKALQYLAKRFYAPVLISCCEEGEQTVYDNTNVEPGIKVLKTTAILAVSNETLTPFDGTIRYAIRNSDGTPLQEGTFDVHCEPQSVFSIEKMNFENLDVDTMYISYELFGHNRGLVSQGTTLFTKPKYFKFKDPHLTYRMDENTILIHADAYARLVEIESPDSDVVFDDNYFDMNAGDRVVHIVRGTCKRLVLRSVYDIR